jgi:anti-sigma regulatory factor (Ser/Thr protein kinase)
MVLNRIYAKHCLVVIFFLLTISGENYAQDPVYKIISRANGLPSNTVYNLLQDKRGFIWMGHDKGLSRYDGKVFKHYTSNTQQGRSLSNLSEANNTIWSQDFSGNFYYVSGDSLIREIRMPPLNYYTAAGFINSSLLTCIGANGIQTLNVSTGEYKEYKKTLYQGAAISFESNRAVVIASDSYSYFDGNKLSAIEKINTAGAKIFFLRKFGGEYYGVSKNSFPVISLIKNGIASPLPLLRAGLFVQDVNIVDDLLWVSTSSGAWCFGLDMKPAFGGHCFFEGKSITKISKDREGNYWFGTLDNGVFFVPDINNRLHTYNNEKLTTLHLSSNSKNLYVGTTNSRILTFDLSNKQFNSIYKGEANHEVLSIIEDVKTGGLLLASDRITLLRNNTLISTSSMAGKSFASFNNELYALAHTGGISLISKIPGKEPAIPLWLRKEGNIWENNHFFLTKTTSRGRFVAFNTVDSTLYGATAKGLFYFSPTGSGTITCNGKEIFASQVIVNGGIVYAASFNNGLYKILDNRKAIQIICKNKPIVSTIYKMFKSEDWVWLVGDGFLQRYDPDKNELIELTEADGLPKAEIKDVAAINSTLYLATTEGLAELDEYAGQENKVPPYLVVNKVLVNGTSVPWEKELFLASKENNIDINFSLPAFKFGDSLSIEYRINSKPWQKMAPGLRTLSLSSLSSGKYSIQLRGFNEDGIASANTEVITLTVASPFYKKPIFLFGMLLLGMAGVYFYFRWRLLNEKRNNELMAQKAKLEQELQQSLLSSIKSQMNPHFLFNALNTIQSYIYTNDKENASQYLGKFSELTRMILDMSTKDMVPLSEEIRALTLYLELEQLRFDDKLMYEFVVDTSISTETTYIHSMLIQPYVENAIKHGLLHKKDNWKLLLKFSKKGNAIEITVDDNGIGRQKSEELNKLKLRRHQSFATNANQTRLEILNKGLKNSIALHIVDKVDDRGQPAGTTVVLTIPLLS